MTDSKKRIWSDDALERVLGALGAAAVAATDAHLTHEQIEAFVAETLDVPSNAAACEHLSQCAACADIVNARYDELLADPPPKPVQGVRPKSGTAARTSQRAARARSRTESGARTAPMTFQPYYPRESTTANAVGALLPGCVEPLELAARTAWDGIQIRTPQHRPFSAALPEPKVDGGVWPLIVTTAFRAAYEYQRGNDWSVVIPLALAPRNARIVILRDSPLAGLSDFGLAASLGGRRIAIADPTSTYAARLASAAAHFGITTIISDSPEIPDEDTLQLVPMAFTAMPEALRTRKIDGFATVEPLPTMAELVYIGREAYAEVTLSADTTSTSTAFCCVVIAPGSFVEGPHFSQAKEALVRALFTSVCKVVKQAFQVSQEPSVISEGPSTLVIGRQATLAMLRHLSDGLRGHQPNARAVMEKLAEQFVPSVTAKSLNADFETLCRFLSRDEQRKLREVFRSRPEPRRLYVTERLREICLQVIEAEFREDIEKGLTRSNESGRPFTLLKSASDRE